MAGITYLAKVGGVGLVAKLSEQEYALRRSERKFSLAFKAAADPIFITRFPSGQFIDINDAFTRVTGFNRGQAIGKTVTELELWCKSSDRDNIRAELAAAGSVHSIELPVRIKNGEIRLGLLSAELVDFDGDNCIVGSWHDITERKKFELKLKRQNAYLSALHETALALLERRDVNDLLETILQRADALVGTPHAYIFLADEASRTLRLTLGTGIYAGHVGSELAYGEGLTGRVFSSGKPLLIKDYNRWQGRSPAFVSLGMESVVGVPLFAAGKTIGVLGVSNRETPDHLGAEEVELLSRFAELASIALDNAYLHQALQKELTQRKVVEKELRYISEHDSLTNLYNRSRFQAELKRPLTEAAAAIICDVDGLKLINDSMGHHCGDALLVAAAEIIRQAVPQAAFSARIGGDEFAIILYGQAEAQAETICLNIRHLVEEHNRLDPNLPLSISTGYAVTNGKTVTMQQLYKEADDSMYREKLHRSKSVRSTIVQALLKALEARDFITEGHGERMQVLAAALGEAAGLPKQTLVELRLIAQFHDIGKVGIPDRILFKPGPLTFEEHNEMKRHCEIGHRIALSTPDLAPIAKYILHHHEWWNGQGYPLGLKGKEIPLECRIIAIADAYDAMTSNRPYRQAMKHEQALAELQRCAGEQFDPWLVELFVSHNGFIDEESTA